MPRVTEVFNKKLKDYLTRMRYKGVTERYVIEIEYALEKCRNILTDCKLLVSPSKITQHHLAIIREAIPYGKDGNQLNKKRHVKLFRSFLLWCGNKTDHLLWPEHLPNRPRITPEDFARVLMGCYEAKDVRGATVMLMLSLSARRVAVLRARPEDISSTQILLKDKGRGGGKPRTIPIGPEDYAQFVQYLNWRQNEIQRVLRNNSNAKIPDGLFIWTRTNKMGTVSKSTVDSIVEQCGRRVGVKLSSHMPRRMTSRELYYACIEAGLPLDTAMEITGHTDRKTFMEYVGAIDDDKRNLMDKVRENRNKLFTEVRGIAEIASQ